MLPSMSPKGLAHPKGARIYLFYEFEGIQGDPPGVIYLIYRYILIYIAPIKAWWIHIHKTWERVPGMEGGSN